MRRRDRKALMCSSGSQDSFYELSTLMNEVKKADFHRPNKIISFKLSKAYLRLKPLSQAISKIL